LSTITFLLVIHNHQPVGNFDWVVDRACDRAYAPFLDVLARHPKIPAAIHHSGCLLDALEARRPEYVERLRELVARGQVEPLTGGYYEPILPVIPEADRLGQIAKLSGWIRERLGAEPAGAWLAERVWEPSLAATLADAGVAYTLVDDSHFLATGLHEDELTGPFVTEDQGKSVRVFPIAKRLRYLIPFEDPEETVAYLRACAETVPGSIAVLGDDGEKFGVWPRTHRRVYRDGWLERFFALLEANAAWIRLALPRDALAAPRGKVYLPDASYPEMMEWALPPGDQQALHDLKEKLTAEGNEGGRFARGGFWRHFFVRYPESDHLHQRGLHLREREILLHATSPDAAATARDRRWAAQCNCAYWHGVFGGLYLPHLREGVHRELLAAEDALERGLRDGAAWSEAAAADFDADGDREVFLRNDRLTLVASPGEGGALHELSDRATGWILGGVVARRPEAYHRLLPRAVVAPPETDEDDAAPAPEESRSIHDLVLAKEPGLAARLHHDRHRRGSLLDRFLGEADDLAQFVNDTLAAPGDFTAGAYTASVAGDRAAVLLTREGTVWRGGEPHAVRVGKEIVLEPGALGFTVAHRVVNLGADPLDARFGIEWNLSVVSDHPESGYRFPDGSRAPFAESGAREGCPEVVLHDGRRAVRLAWDRAAGLWWFPVETISLSEQGFERVTQGQALLAWWRLELPPGATFSVTTRLTLEPRA